MVDASVLKARAKELAAAGDVAQALRVCHELLAADPDDVAAWLSVGNLCRKLGKNEPAVRAYARAARLFAERGSLIQAISANRMILEVDPEHTQTQEQLAKLHGKARERRAAQPAFDEVELGGEAEAEPEADEALDADTAEHVSPAEAAPPPAPEPEPADLDDDDIMAEPLPDAEVLEPEAAAEPPEAEIIEEIDEVIVLDDEVVLLEEEADEAADAVIGELLEDDDAHADWQSGDVESNELLMALPEVPLFGDLDPEVFVGVINEIRRLRFFPDETILAEGDDGDAFYAIASGAARVSKRDPGGEEIELAVLKAGAFFGEFAFLAGTPRSASVTAVDHCDVLEFSHEAMDALIAKHPKIREVLEGFYRRRLVDGALKINPIIRALDQRQRDALIREMRPTTAPPGEVLLGNGQVAERVFVIIGGAVQATGAGAAQLLPPGEFFGAVELLGGGPSRRTYTAAGEVRLYEIPGAFFRKVAEAVPAVRQAVDEAAARRR